MIGEEIFFEEFGGVYIYSLKSGVVYFIVEDEYYLFDMIKYLLLFIFLNNMEDLFFIMLFDLEKRFILEFESIILLELNKVYDVKEIIYKVVDN